MLVSDSVIYITLFWAEIASLQADLYMVIVCLSLSLNSFISASISP